MPAIPTPFDAVHRRAFLHGSASVVGSAALAGLLGAVLGWGIIRAVSRSLGLLSDAVVRRIEAHVLSYRRSLGS